MNTDNYTTYGVGTKAYLDTFAGMVPCVVTEILRPGANGKLITRDDVVIKLTQTVQAYKKGEILTESASSVVPRKQIIERKYSRRVNVCYKYVT